jgi:hypothetical protein
VCARLGLKASEEGDTGNVCVYQRKTERKKERKRETAQGINKTSNITIRDKSSTISVCATTHLEVLVRIPVAVKDDDRVGCLKIEPQAAGSRTAQR